MTWHLLQHFTLLESHYHLYSAQDMIEELIDALHDLQVAALCLVSSSMASSLVEVSTSHPPRIAHAC